MNYFILNTNMRENPDDDAYMLRYHRAAAFDTSKHVIERIQKDDRVFLYRNKEGIVALGTACVDNPIIMNRHNDQTQIDAEYHMPLTDFRVLKAPLSAKDMKGIGKKGYAFDQTLHNADAKNGVAGIKLWNYIQKHCL